MKVSITLPSLFPDLLDEALASIERNTHTLDYEAVVVSPFPVHHPRVRWVEEKEQRGNCAAHLEAFRHATGDIIVAFSDDFRLEDGSLDRAVAFLIEREKRFFPYSCGIFNGFAGTVFGIYYPFLPVMSRRSIEAVGGYFDDGYSAHFADVDLALRVWAAGGRCELAPLTLARGIIDRHLLPEARHRSTAHAADLRAFLAHWKPIYGTGWGSRLRDFNIDVVPDLFPAVIEDHSIIRNFPEFGQLIHQIYAETGIVFEAE